MLTPENMQWLKALPQGPVTIDAGGWPRRTARPAVAARNGRPRFPVVTHLRPDEGRIASRAALKV